ncbi:MAG: hypothetical protein KDE09_08105, partial [Anaerolineales bacterium]|nr:hypothetical protein [Anaerolineales bacterium]
EIGVMVVESEGLIGDSGTVSNYFQAVPLSKKQMQSCRLHAWLRGSRCVFFVNAVAAHTRVLS